MYYDLNLFALMKVDMLGSTVSSLKLSTLMRPSLGSGNPFWCKSP